MQHTTASEAAHDAHDFWRRLLHRWFVEYNPLYLLSATLVLGGMLLLSRALAAEGSVYGQIGVAAIAELYAAALIGGAALLMRIGQRRPAVMLAVLTVVYQWDLTLHTEACRNLGGVGDVAAAAWLAAFVAKLHALAWAMKLRLSRSARAAAVVAASGLVVVPRLFDAVGPHAASAVVALWMTALVSLQGHGSVTSKTELDAWGHVVLRRAVRVAWILSAGLLALHVLFWSAHWPLERGVVVPAILLCLVPRIRTEARVWCVAGATLVVMALFVPSAFGGVALVAAVALALRAKAGPPPTPTRSSPVTEGADGSSEAWVERGVATPYRASVNGPVAATTAPAAAVVDGRAASLRLLGGAVLAAYLSAWTWSWSGGPWPAHVLWLDLLLTATLALGWLRERRRAHEAGARTPLAPLPPIVATWMHWVVQARLVPTPRSTLEWGGASVVLGFVLLLASLGVSFWLRAPRGSSSARPAP